MGKTDLYIALTAEVCMILLVELACNLGIRCWLAKRKLAGKFRRAAGKRIKQFWNWLGTGILILIVVMEPLDLPRILRIQLDDTGIFLSRAVFIVQLICILTFFLTRPLWLKWLMDRACGMGVVSEEAVSEGQLTKGQLAKRQLTKAQLADHVQTAFLILCLLVFGNILPYFLYINGHLHKFAVMWMAWWAFDLWDYGFGSPLYLILTGAKEILPLCRRIPWLSCAASVLLAWNFPLPYDMTRCGVLIICLFLLECTVLLVWKIREEKARGNT